MVWNKNLSKLDAFKSDVAKAYERGESLATIGKKYGTTANTVQRLLKREGIPRRRCGGQYKETCKVPDEPWKLAYLAAALDCDGSIFLMKDPSSIGGKSPHISVSNTNTAIISWLERELGGRVYMDKSSGPNRNWKPRYRWVVTSTIDVYKVLKKIITYLTNKKKNAEEVLKFCEFRLRRSGYVI